MTRTSGSRGSATAETAVLLPVLVVVLAAALWVLACVGAQLTCVDAARAAARAAARGDTSADVRAVGQRLAPPGAAVQVSSGDGTVQVLVSAEARPFGHVLRVLPALTVSGRATAAVEPGVAAASVSSAADPGPPPRAAPAHRPLLADAP